MLYTFSSLCGRHLPIWKKIWLPLTTVERAKVSPSFPNQPFLSTAALQEFTSPVLCHLHHTAAAAHGILSSRLEQGWGWELHKPALRALQEDSSTWPPCSLLTALRGSSLQAQGEGMGAGTGAVLE